jgi:hypothetical protein
MAETLQLIITADNKEALKAIEDLAKSTEGLKYKFQDVKKGTGEATNAMINFSRLAEDSAYGIRGAANNINPFIESFSRLKEKAKESGTTIMQELIPTLTGPAGLAVAVSLISALYIAWSDHQNKAKKEAEELAKANGRGADEIKRQKEAVDNIFESVAKETTEVSLLISVLNNENETRKRKEDALERLKKLNPEIFGDLKIEQGIVNGLNSAYDTYITNLEDIIFIRTKQLELEKVTTEILKRKGVLDTEEQKNIKNTGAALKSKLDLLKTDDQLRKEGLNAQIKSNQEEAKTNNLYNQRDAILKAISERTKGIKISGADGGGNADKLTETQNIVKSLREQVRSLDYELSKGLLKEIPANSKDKESYYTEKIKAISDAIKKLAGLTSGEAKIALSQLENLLSQTKVEYAVKLMDAGRQSELSATGEKKLDPERTARQLAFFDTQLTMIGNQNARRRTKFTEEEIKKQEQAYLEFANAISGTVTNSIMGMWDAMQRGESVMSSLGDMLANIAKELLATAIQAAILSAILSSLPGADVAVAANGGQAKIGFFDIFKNLLGLADGGVVTGPTLAMIGEGSESEAVLPLSKLGNIMQSSFNAGSMNSTSVGQNGQFVLRGQDLVLAMQRSNSALNLRRGV